MIDYSIVINHSYVYVYIYIYIKPTNISLGPTDLIWDGEELVMMKTVCELEANCAT